jgi:hypothetical protein
MINTHEMDKHILETFISLTEGRILEKEWLDWFENNKDVIEKTCGRTAFLKIKPKESLTQTGNIFAAQTAVFNWLKTQNINADLNDIYKKAYNAEFDAFCRAEKQKEKEKRDYLKNNFSEIEKSYPKFFKQILQTFDNANNIEKGKSESEIIMKEKGLGVFFSDDLKTFFSLISKLDFEGLTVDFEELYVEKFNEKEYLVLGEFWLHGDGDLLLYNLDNFQISIYAHEYRPPEILKLSASMTILLEKNITAYLKSYE